MTCKEFEKQIPLFLAGELEKKELKSFIEHAKECADCKEELTIQFLVTEGLTKLEDGSAFDLDAELNKKMEDAEHGLDAHSKMKMIFLISFSITVAGLAVLIYLLFFLS